MNFRAVRGPYGGANSFLRTLRKALGQRGVEVTQDVAGRHDVALLNALTEDIDLGFVRQIAERGIPVVHRKVGYRASGRPEMRAVVDGVVEGDRRQIAFSPYVSHTVFQSVYSRDVFLSGGFSGEHSVIHNGVDEDLFNPTVRRGFLGGRERRSFWDGREPLQVVISTWSADPLKGFEEYARIDGQLSDRSGVEVTLVGRRPEWFRPQRIRLVPPQPAHRLAQCLKEAHVLLQLAQFETCSNALIEGLNCGLPAIYLDSGANREIAGPYGVVYEGDFFEALDRVKELYAELVERLRGNPYRIGSVVERYIALLERLAL